MSLIHLAHLQELLIKIFMKPPEKGVLAIDRTKDHQSGSSRVWDNFNNLLMPRDNVVDFGWSWPSPYIVGADAEQVKGWLLLQLLDVLANLLNKIFINETACDASVDNIALESLHENLFCLPDGIKLTRQVAHDVRVSMPHLVDQLVFNPEIKITNTYTYCVKWVIMLRICGRLACTKKLYGSVITVVYKL